MVMASGQGSSITRQLNFTVSRQFGNQGTVQVTISMYYDQVTVNYLLHIKCNHNCVL